MTASAILAISYRDLMKFLRDPARIISTLILPLLMIGALGGSLQANLGSGAGYDFLTFTFSGVLAQTLFMSATQGVVSLIEDRASDFSQEMFVSPVSRYAIVFGKILGESLVALPQGAAIVAFGLLIGVPLSALQIVGLALVAVAVSLFGGAFGVLVLSNLNSQSAANNVFTFIMLPQFFLAGVFSPIQVLPWYLDILSRLSPMRYAVDLARGVYYAGQPDYSKVILGEPLVNILVMAVLFAIFLVAGTVLFVRREQNR